MVDAAQQDVPEMEQVWVAVVAANTARNWRGVLQCEGRLDELVVNDPDQHVDEIMKFFGQVHGLGINLSGSAHRAVAQ